MNEQPTVLIDVMNTAFRCHFAFRNLTDEEGRATGAQFGVLKTIADLQNKISRRLVFCWDHGVPVLGAPKPRNWRDDVLKGYKANRVHDPSVREALFPQLPPLARMIECLGYENVSAMGLEADDVIGILSQELPGPVLIFSTDKDFYQLLDDRFRGISVLVPKKDDRGQFRTITAQDVRFDSGIDVDRWSEYLALGGDGSDNIKPAYGMGPRTAIKLIRSGVDLSQDLQRSWKAAHIPVCRDDSRVKNLIRFNRPTAKQSWKDNATKAICQKEFERFCADRNMVTLLAMRRSLFYGDTTSQCPPTAVSRNRTRKAPLPRGTLV